MKDETFKPKTFSEYQDLLLAMMYFIDDMCRRSGIKYTVIDGTLLGAVRDKNIIPWDGDIDIAMTHKELEKLKVAFDEYDGRYFLSYFPNHFYKKKKHYGLIHARVVDKKASNPLLCIDVFTIDFLGNDYEQALETVEEYKRLESKSVSSVSFHLPPVKKEKPFRENFRNVLLGAFYPVFWTVSKILTPGYVKKFTKFTKEKLLFDEDSKYYTIEPYLGRFGVEENDILADGYIDLPFSTFKVMAVANYETYLIKTYGDYMRLPPPEKRVPYPSEKELLDCDVALDDELENLLAIVKGEKND
ncbi:MAG: LicD family protein [Clostridia bacterium]|nr:LicD family protein [Clostridia bacterium]